MPTYTYRCRSCNYEFDKRQRMADAPLIDCPSCGEAQLRKVINSAGIVFKGSGFYVTDNRNGTAQPANDKAKTDNPKKDTSEAASEVKKSDSSSETAQPKTSEKTKTKTKAAKATA